jgi:hypothetical protein
LASLLRETAHQLEPFVRIADETCDLDHATCESGFVCVPCKCPVQVQVRRCADRHRSAARRSLRQGGTSQPHRRLQRSPFVTVCSNRPCCVAARPG